MQSVGYLKTRQQAVHCKILTISEMAGNQVVTVILNKPRYYFTSKGSDENYGKYISTTLMPNGNCEARLASK